MTVAEALRLGEQQLAEAGIDTPRVDAELLLAHVLGVSRTGVYAQDDIEVPGTYEDLLGRRSQREPLAYVLGEWGFRRLTLKTDARALVPRPETETLVERALVLAAGVEQPRILDVGVGSGAIALALKDERPDAQITGVDLSADALALARQNAELLGLEIELREGDGADAAAEGWDVVVANPPYVESLDDVQPELRWEPEVALLGNGEHERLARAARARFVLFEVGDGQARGVAEMLERLGFWDVAITADLAGRDRVVEARLP